MATGGKTEWPNKPAKKRLTNSEILYGFASLNDMDNVERPDTFRLPGNIGAFMGDLQQYKLSILLTGDPHAGKTQVAYQLVDAFAESGKKVGVLDLEQGGLTAKDTVQTINRNVKPKNRNNIAIKGELEGGLEELRQFANDFDVIMIDSFMELNIAPDKLKDLRNDYPNTIFIIIAQENVRGTTFGGQTADYIANVVLRVVKVDATFVNNYAEMEKNRGNEIGGRYYFVNRRIESRDEVAAAQDEA